MPFLTTFNTNRTLKAISKLNILDVESWRPYIKDIYFLNKLDLSNLFYFDKYCESVSRGEEIDIGYYQKVEIEDKHEFIFEGNKPSYHKSEYCPKLHSNFSNFKIPEEIKKKGTEAIKEFRVWFKENVNLLDKDPAAFAMRLHNRFKIINLTIERVNYDNSGFTYKENFTKEILYTRINSLLSNAATYFKIDQQRQNLLKKYQRATFLAFKEEPLNMTYGYTEEEAKTILKEYYYLFVEPILFYLKELIAVNYKNNNVSISFELGEPLLQILGFTRCPHCYNENYSEEFNIESELHTLKQRFGAYHFSIEPSVFVFHSIPNSTYQIAFFYARVMRLKENRFYKDTKGNNYIKVVIDFVDSNNHYVYREAKFYTNNKEEIILYKKYITRISINKTDNQEYYQVYKNQ